MGTRTVRLDHESERLLARICQNTGMSVSAALKRGLVLVASGQANQPGAEPFTIYRSLDLGPGGYARAPAREAKASVRAVVRRKHHR